MAGRPGITNDFDYPVFRVPGAWLAVPVPDIRGVRASVNFHYDGISGLSAMVEILRVTYDCGQFKTVRCGHPYQFGAQLRVFVLLHRDYLSACSAACLEFASDV